MGSRGSGGSCSRGSGSAAGASGGAGTSIGICAGRTRSDVDGACGTLDTVGANTVLVVNDAGGGEDTRVGLALDLATGIESSGLAVAGAGSSVGLNNGVIGTIVVGPVDSVAGGNVELLGREQTVDDVYIPGLCKD